MIPALGKTRITLYLDDEIVPRFKTQAEETGNGCQTLINEALKVYLGLQENPLTPEVSRELLCEELMAQE